MHQPYASSVCDRDETEPDILSHAYDRVSEAGYRLQGGACAIWRINCTIYTSALFQGNL